MAECIYVAGKMRGVWRFNFPAFDDAARHLRAQGYDVINPAELDREAGFDPFELPDDHDWNHLPDTLSLHEVFERDIAQVFECDKLAVLDGWETSSGACLEVTLAHYLGKPVVDAYTLEAIDLSHRAAMAVPSDHREESILEEAQRLTRLDRQNAYGHPYEDFTRTAGMWSAYKGTDFTPEDVGMMMVLLKVSREKNKHKRDNRTDAAGYLNCVQMIRDYRGEAN